MRVEVCIGDAYFMSYCSSIRRKSEFLIAITREYSPSTNDNGKTKEYFLSATDNGRKGTLTASKGSLRDKR